MRSPAIALALLFTVLSWTADARLSETRSPSLSLAHALSPRAVGVVGSDPRHPATPTIPTQGPTKTRVPISFAVDPSKATNNLAASATATQSVGVADGGESTADHFAQCEDRSDHSCPKN